MVSCPKGVRVLKLKRSSVFLIVVMGLLATSGIAFAGHDDSHAEDTQFSFGYDETETNHILSLNVGPNWEPYVCDFENGALTATYGDPDPDTGIMAIDTLKDGDDAWEFKPRTEETGLHKDETLANDTVKYAGTDGKCALWGVEVAGPNGQFNHGQFMKAAKSLLNDLFEVSLYEVKGHGCLVRHLAQSDIGKTGWTEPDITFFTFEADCDRGKKNGNVEAESTRGGRPDSPGKSGEDHGKKP
jgi:hypothetical protein